MKVIPRNTLTAITLGIFTISMVSIRSSAGVIDINFDSGVDSFGNAAGILVYNGPDGFTVTFNDDDSSGVDGPDAPGVGIVTGGFGVAPDAPGDLELVSSNEFHTSGIVATFNQPVSLVSLFDNDDDFTPKTLYAFDAFGSVIGQTAPGSQQTFTIDLSLTGGQQFFAVEFDTLPGTAGGANDGTHFSIDDFHAEFGEAVVPEPSTYALVLTGIAGLGFVRRRVRT